MKSRFVILSLVLVLFLVSGGVSCLGEAGGGGFGSCSPNNMTTDMGADVLVEGSLAEDQTSDTLSGLDEGLPVQLPVTIAKNEDGADATSFQFAVIPEVSGVEPMYSIVGGETGAEATADDDGVELAEDQVVGTVTGRLLRESGTVGIVQNTKFIETIDASDGTFEFDVAAEQLDVPFAVVAFVEGSTPENQGPVSPPVIVIVSYDDVAEDYVMTVHLTNTGPQVNDPQIAAAIADAPLAVASGGRVAFSATNKDGEAFLGSVSIFGGANAVLAEGLANTFSAVEYASAGGRFYGTDSVTGGFLGITAEGALDEIGALADAPVRRVMKVHPRGAYAAVNVNAVNPNTGEPTQTVRIYRLADAVEMTLPIPAGESESVIDLSLDWSDPSHLILIKQFSGGTYAAESHMVAGLMAGSGLAMPPMEFSFVSENYVANPTSDGGYRGLFAYECLADSGSIALCSYDRRNDSRVEIVSGPFDAAGARFSSDGSRLAFQRVEQRPEGEMSEIGVIDPPNFAVKYVSRGKHPKFLPDDSRKLVSLRKDMSGHMQIAFANLPGRSGSDPLRIDSSGLLVPADDGLAVLAAGGVPPYSFSMVEGGGSIDADTGFFSAPSSPGQASVRVTDATGAVSDAVVTVVPRLSLSLNTPAVRRGMTVPLEVEGGVGPYSYKVIVGGGSVDASGVFTAGDSQGVTTIKVTDAFGHVSTIDVKVGGLAGESDAWWDGDGVSSVAAVPGAGNNGFDGILLPDGKLVAGGFVIDGGETYVMLARFNPDGSPDLSFGLGGVAVPDLDAATTERAFAIAADFQGRIVVVGESKSKLSGMKDVLIARFSANGSLDATFGTNGKVVTDITGDNDKAIDVSLQPDGKIVTVGHSKTVGGGYDVMVARYLPDGGLDATFDGDGIVRTDAVAGGDNFDDGYAVALQADGKIVVGGWSDVLGVAYATIFRYHADGSLDGSFDGDGRILINFSGTDDKIQSLAVQPDGKIVFVGETKSALKMAVAGRVNVDGTSDGSFNGGVPREFSAGLSDTILFDVAVLSDGNILAAGIGGAGGNDMIIARLLGDGSPAMPFGAGGIVTSDLGQSENGMSLQIQPEGLIFVIGASGSAPMPIGGFGTADTVVWRLWL